MVESVLEQVRVQLLRVLELNLEVFIPLME